MSILTDFFIATPEDVDALSVEQLLRDLFPILETNNVDSSKIEILAHLIVENPQEKMIVLVKGAAGEKFVSVDRWDEKDLIGLEQWIERLDPVFVECLASISAEQVPHIATQWAIQWAEFDGRPVGKNDSESVSELMRQLCQLAKRARAEEKQMYLRTCV
jgi:hypothetical protein